MFKLYLEINQDLFVQGYVLGH